MMISTMGRLTRCSCRQDCLTRRFWAHATSNQTGDKKAPLGEATGL
jgi:hypothetical protein